MNNYMRRTILFVMACLAVVSCGRTSSQKLLPSVSGKAGEILVVMDKTPWEGNLGAEVRELLACDCPYLVQREPLYSLVNIVPSNFANIFQVHRNLLIFDINPQVREEKISYLSDVWARPQCVVQVNAASEESALALVKENSELIVNTIEQAERDRVVANTMRYEELSIAKEIAEIFPGTLHFPSGYKLMKKTSDFVWVADVKQYVTQGVLIYRYPVKGDQSDFDLDEIIRHKNSILKDNVPGMFENTYMTVADAFPPTLKFVKYKSREMAQIRGFWEVYNDYMGGPFVSHVFYSPDGKEMIVLDAFVYAPRYDKRQYLRQVESLLYSFAWNEVKS